MIRAVTVPDVLRRAGRRVSAHRGEAFTVGAFMVIVGVVSSSTGLSGRLASAAGAGLAGGLLVSFATLWLPIAVIDFRRCTRETALRRKVEADLERHACEARERAEELSAITDRVRAVLTKGGPRVVFQPIVEITSGSVVGYEALSRFDDGRAPDEWFHDAARAGLGVDLELAAVRNALGALPTLPESAYLSVNVSPDALHHPGVIDLVAASAADRVVIELTEHLALEDYDHYRAVIAELRAVGARVAVDDAGSGYASFRHIVDLGPDIIKVDRSLVHGVHLDPARRSLMTAFAAFARDLGATLIAEGVERPEEEAALQHWGVRFAQGWLYGRPQALPQQPSLAMLS